METKTAQALRELARHYAAQLCEHSAPSEIVRAYALASIVRAYPRCVSEGHKVGFTGAVAPYTAQVAITRSENGSDN